MDPLASTLNLSRGFVSPQILQVFISILLISANYDEIHGFSNAGASYHGEFWFSKVRFLSLPSMALQG
jgi:hypothetical protein